MTDLETKLRAAVEHGCLQGFTLFATYDGLWQAAVSPDKISWRVAIDAAPVAAALKALGAVEPSIVAIYNDGQEGIFG